MFTGTLIFITSDSTSIRVEANTLSKTWVAYLPDGSQASGPSSSHAGQQECRGRSWPMGSFCGRCWN